MKFEIIANLRNKIIEYINKNITVKKDIEGDTIINILIYCIA